MLLQKVWNWKWQPRNGCNDRLRAKFLTMTIRVNLCCFLHVWLGYGTAFTWTVVTINLLTAILWPSFWISHLYFTTEFWRETYFFYSLAVLDEISLLFTFAFWQIICLLLLVLFFTSSSEESFNCIMHIHFTFIFKIKYINFLIYVNTCATNLAEPSCG